MKEAESVWGRLMHHEIRKVFAHRRRAGGCGPGRVRNRRRSIGIECTEHGGRYLHDALYYAGEQPDHFWPHDVWPGDDWSTDHRAGDH